MHEIKSIATVRQEESLSSDIVGELSPGTEIRILEMGVANKRRARVAGDKTEGRHLKFLC